MGCEGGDATYGGVCGGFGVGLGSGCLSSVGEDELEVESLEGGLNCMLGSEVCEVYSKRSSGSSRGKLD
jgi:hypothetical protein